MRPESATLERAPTPATSSQQQFGTQGIAPLVRPSLVTRAFMKVVAFAERLNLRFAILGNPPVYDNAAFPWVAEVERASAAIREELARVLQRQDELPAFQDISTDVATITQDTRWKTFLLTAYGLTSENNIQQCPRTWEAVRKIPGLQTAMFSIFEPGKHLPPHRGPYNGVLRLHLGLVVPEASTEELAIRVDRQVCRWQEGRALVFDDAYEHEAWNHTDRTRVVLFVDFVKPLRWPARLMNACLLNLAVFTPFIREGLENHEAWERRFYAEAEALRNGSAG